MKSKIAYQVHVGETDSGMAVLDVRLQASGPEGFKALKQGLQEIFASAHPLGSLTDPEDRATLLKHMAEIPDTLEEIKAKELAEVDVSPENIEALERRLNPKALDLLKKMPFKPADHVKAMQAVSGLPYERQPLMVALAGISMVADIANTRAKTVPANML